MFVCLRHNVFWISAWSLLWKEHMPCSIDVIWILGIFCSFFTTYNIPVDKHDWLDQIATLFTGWIKILLHLFRIAFPQSWGAQNRHFLSHYFLLIFNLLKFLTKGISTGFKHQCVFTGPGEYHCIYEKLYKAFCGSRGSSKKCDTVCWS